MAMAVLVTGGTGFLGLNLAEALLAAGETVVLHGHVAPPAGAVTASSAMAGGRAPSCAWPAGLHGQTANCST